VIDDPTFPAPVQRCLVKTGAEQSHSLFWEPLRKQSLTAVIGGGSGRRTPTRHDIA
jgi:hypothetical protein